MFFKFIKRTLNGIHLFNHSENGVEIQFYLLMTLAILTLKLRQDSQALEYEIIEKKKEKAKKEEEKKSDKTRKSTRMDQRKCENILQIVENKQELADGAKELISQSV